MTQGRGRRQEYTTAGPDRTREEMIFAVLSLPRDLDSRIRPLVETLENLPDLYPCSSCGGHPDPGTRENPAPEGHFYVQFILEPTEKGFLSLGILDLAARNTDHDNLSLRVLNCTDNPNLVMFHLLGKDGADPDLLAREVGSLCRKWGVACQGVRDYKVKVRKHIAHERILGT